MKKLSEVIQPAFRDVYKSMRTFEKLRYVLKGGRGSGKSTIIAFFIVLYVIKFPFSVLVVRKVANTLRESVFEQIKEACEILEVSDKFSFYTSPLSIVYNERGNKILFRGADDPQKIKSLKVASYPVALLWVEEAGDFADEDDVSMIEKSILRGQLSTDVDPNFNYMFLYSYNPPKRKVHWLNKKYNSQFVADNTLVHHSTYQDNLHLSQAMIEEAEFLRDNYPLRYRYEMLGEPIGAGVVPFDNVTYRRITDEEIRSFDRIRQGIDWGYAVDPTCFVRVHYDRKKRKLYIIDEIYKVQLFNEDLADMLINRRYHLDHTTADSAEPRSIAQVKNKGVKIHKAKKGKGSVEHGEKWLAELDEIVIDVKRTPNVAKEFETIDYATDRNGEVLTRLEDKNNHSIDALRYALENDMTLRKARTRKKQTMGFH